MKIAIIGLGKMGYQIAEKLLKDNHKVVTFDYDSALVDKISANGAIAAYSEVEVVKKLAEIDSQKAIIWLMIPSQYIDESISQWQGIIDENTILIDGGNSDYRGDFARYEKIEKAGSTLLDIGTSGGVWGMENGFSMMVGGANAAYEEVKPILDTLARPNGGHKYFGKSGSGHYVKMIHNAIEYGMMESLAEGYRMLKEGPFDNIDLAKAGDIWQQSSVITSWLNDLTRQALHENPTLANIDGVVAESGEARWTLETAHNLNINMPSIQAAFDVRLKSQNGEINFATKLLAAMRNKFGGHNINGK
jgi:6-phosphogluconate dehydrogenase